MSGFSSEIICFIIANASFGCNGKSGESTTAFPANASRNALAGTHCPLAKNPCKNNTFNIACKDTKNFD
jgi:hypothetical protein